MSIAGPLDGILRKRITCFGVSRAERVATLAFRAVLYKSPGLIWIKVLMSFSQLHQSAWLLRGELVGQCDRCLAGQILDRRSKLLGLATLSALSAHGSRSFSLCRDR